MEDGDAGLSPATPGARAAVGPEAPAAAGVGGDGEGADDGRFQVDDGDRGEGGTFEEYLLDRDTPVGPDYGEEPDEERLGAEEADALLKVAGVQWNRCPPPCAVALSHGLRLMCGDGGMAAVSVLSWNVRSGVGSAGRAALEGAIRAGQPHVVALQEWDIERGPSELQIDGRVYEVPARMVELLRATGRAGGHSVMFLRDDLARLVQDVAVRSEAGEGYFARVTLMTSGSGRCHVVSVHAPVNGAEMAWSGWWEALCDDLEAAGAGQEVVVMVGDHNFTLWGEAGYCPPREAARVAIDAARRSAYVAEMFQGPAEPLGSCRSDSRGDRGWEGVSAFDFPVWRNVTVRGFAVLAGWEYGSDHRMFRVSFDLALPAEYAEHFQWRRGVPRRGSGRASRQYTACCSAMAAAVLGVAPGPGSLALVHDRLSVAAGSFAEDRQGGRYTTVEAFLQRLRGWFVVCCALWRRMSSGQEVERCSDFASDEACTRLREFLEWFRPLEARGSLSWGARASRIEGRIRRTEAAVRGYERAEVARQIVDNWHDMGLHFEWMQARLGRVTPKPVGIVRLRDGSLSTDPFVVRRELAEWGGYQSRPAFAGAVPGSVDVARREAALEYYAEMVRQWVPGPAPFRPEVAPDGSAASSAGALL
eukprot:gene5615-3124_t